MQKLELCQHNTRGMFNSGERQHTHLLQQCQPIFLYVCRRASLSWLHGTSLSTGPLPLKTRFLGLWCFCYTSHTIWCTLQCVRSFFSGLALKVLTMTIPFPLSAMSCLWHVSVIVVPGVLVGLSISWLSKAWFVHVDMVRNFSICRYLELQYGRW